MKNEQRTTNNKQRTYKAFTLLELAVAVGLLAVMILFASLIFNMSIDTYRMATANAEIMQKLQVITGQLNADFKGMILPPSGRIHFGYPDKSYVYSKLVYTLSDVTKDVRSDGIIFFANGDFQSTAQYLYEKSSGGEGLKTVCGDVACIFYALADVTTYSLEEKPDPKKKILMRRQIILTSDSTLKDKLSLNELAEYCNTQSLADLIADPGFDANNLMDNHLDLRDPNDLVTYMARGVDDFTIQYVGEDSSLKAFNEWRPSDGEINAGWLGKFNPTAFKFTFTLYDSKGIIKNGKTFTHIVYLGE
jgi:type II secretory pathway pseudopilin PulG